MAALKAEDELKRAQAEEKLKKREEEEKKKREDEEKKKDGSKKERKEEHGDGKKGIVNGLLSYIWGGKNGESGPESPAEVLTPTKKTPAPEYLTPTQKRDSELMPPPTLPPPSANKDRSAPSPSASTFTSPARSTILASPGSGNKNSYPIESYEIADYCGR